MTTQNMLSVGIYDPPTAARLQLASRMANEAYPVSSRALIRWIHAGLATPSLKTVPGREIILSFEDLVSLRLIAALRAYKVSWRAIRRAEAWLRDTTGTLRPFAREELWTTSSTVYVKFKGIIIAASRNGQIAMEILQDYLFPVSGLAFVNKVAARWTPAPGILIDPTIQFGEPCIEGTRIPVRAVVSSVDGGDPPDLVQRSYRLTDAAMTAALKWGELATAA